jgi:DNA-binding transcriptional LysR family regulator
MSRFDLPDVGTKELLTIIALAEHGSFVRAASQLHVTQPALTRTVKRLERTLGVLLFSRTTRRVEITPAGRECVALARRVMNDLKVMPGKRHSQIASEPISRVTVSTYSTVASQMMPSLVCRFLATKVSVEVHIRECSPEAILEDIRSGAADFGVGPMAVASEPFGRRVLFREHLWVALPPGHRLCQPGRRSVRLAELRGEPLVSLLNDSLFRQVAEAAATAMGLSIRWAVAVDSTSSLVAYVRAGVGAALVPSGVLPLQRWEGFEAYPLARPAVSRAVGLIRLKSRRLQPAATAFADHLLERFRAPTSTSGPGIEAQLSCPGLDARPHALSLQRDVADAGAEGYSLPTVGEH